MELCIHIPHIPLNPPTIKVILILNDEELPNHISLDTRLFGYSYPDAYRDYTIGDMVNKHLTLPIADTVPFNELQHTVLKTLTGQQENAPTQWLKTEKGWLFQHTLQIRRIWYDENDMKQFHAL